MKTTDVLIGMGVYLIAIAPFQACKKDNGPKPICKIITAASSNETVNISYNAEGKVASIARGVYTKTFQYAGNNIVINETNAGSFFCKHIITLNNSGFISNRKLEKNPSGTNWDNMLYEYSGTQLIKITNTTSAGGSPKIETFEWSNGNLVTHHYFNGTTTYEYYMDKPMQEGDYFQYIQLVNYGSFFATNKNLLKSFGSTSYITTMDYSFASDGKISGVSVNNGTPPAVTFNYQYQCN